MTRALRATYRLQFRGGFGFGFAEAAEIVPTLARLGVSHLYAAPIFAAREGSTHGYDAVDPNVLDPDLGGDAGFATLVQALHAHDMGLLLDIVPNHLGVSPANPYWQSFLRWGRDAETAAFFDIDWEARAGGTPGKLLLPVLGKPFADVLANRELTLAVDRDGPDLAIAYYDARFPLDPRTWPTLLPDLPRALRERLAAATPASFQEMRADLRRHWPATVQDAPEIIAAVIASQSWALAFWREGNAHLNWRRFFDITELVGVKVEEPAVFEATHRRTLAMVAAGEVDGLRIDHIDGLADPGRYLDELDARWREVAPDRPPWLLVEKILGPGERLPAGWPVAGTTGYEVLNDLCGLFVDPSGRAALDRAWRAVGGDPDGFPAEVARAKRLILDRNLGAETSRVAARLADLGPGLTVERVREALIAVASALPVYRTYGAGAPLAGEDRRRMLDAVARSGSQDRDALDLLTRVLIDADPAGAAGARVRSGFEQLTGPAMAKALEDTAFYRWYRLVALNEVGGDPARFGLSPEGLHATFAERAEHGTAALVPTATHDTKRGEDTRLRIAALSGFGTEWEAEAEAWSALNAAWRPDVVERDTEYLIYQTLLGCYPLVRGPAAMTELPDRLVRYIEKALREAKRRTDWLSPDAEYEAAVADFVRGLLDPARAPHFIGRLEAMVDRIAPVAAVHGLAQTVLKVTAPGVPDLYQGTELWDFSLVDPDNRRPVDFGLRARLLADDGGADTLANWRDGRLKLALLERLLGLRRTEPEIWRRGRYRPLTPTGTHAARLFGFARELDGQTRMVVVPRNVRGLLSTDGLRLRPDLWADTRIALPDVRRGMRVRDLLAGRTSEVADVADPATLFQTWPVAVLAVERA